MGQVPALDVLRPIALMANAVSGPGYAKVYGTTRSCLPRRFDWFIAIDLGLNAAIDLNKPPST